MPTHHEQRTTDARSARYQPLVIVLVAFAAGIGVDRWASLPAGAAGTVSVAGLAVWAVLWWRRRNRAAAAMLVLAVAACGATWHHCQWQLFPCDDLGSSAGPMEQPACIEAVALRSPCRVPSPRPTPLRGRPATEQVRLEVRVVGVRDGPAWRTASGRARLLVAGPLPDVGAGDRVRVFCQLAAPRPQTNPGDFDAQRYHRADRLRCLLRAEHPACVCVIEPAKRWSPAALLGMLRSAGDRLVWRYVAPSRAGLAAAVLLGIREEVPAEQTESFMETGTIHILSISGLHVGILAGCVFYLLRLAFVPKSWTAGVVGFVTVLYTLLTDAEPPAVRAMILVLIVCGSHCLGRPGLAFNSLAAAGLVVLALHPAHLCRVGVQLSFLCVAGLSWYNHRHASRQTPLDPLDRLIEQTRPWPIRAARDAARWAWGMTVLGGAIWLLTLPLIMARMHLISPVAVVLNTLLWLPMTAALCSGLGMMACGPLPPFAAAFGWLCDKTFAVLQWGVDAASHWPGAYFWVPGPADWWLAGFYGMLGLWAAVPRWQPPRRWTAAIVAAWCAAGLLPHALPAPAQCEATFVSVGHGLAVIVRLPSHRTMLYDAGSMLSPEMAARCIAATLWSKGITHLDAVVLSHADADHFNALPALCQQFTIGAVYVPPSMLDATSPALDALRQSLRPSRVPLAAISAGDRLCDGSDCAIEVLHPPRRYLLTNDNAQSLVLAIELQGRRILLPGDLEPPGTEDLIAEEPWHCDVLLAPHHGSGASNPPGLSRWAKPRWVVVSGGPRIDTQRTATAYHAAGARVLHTGYNGAIQVTITEGEIAIESFLGGPP